MRTKNYIGVTGCATISDARKLTRMFRESEIEMLPNHELMIGVLVSRKTIIGNLTSVRYPALDLIPDILGQIKGQCFVTLHYNTRNINFAGEIIGLLEYCKIHDKVDGIQLNVNNPLINEIKKVKEHFPRLKIIYQLRDYSSNKYELLRKNRQLLDHVLIDSSLGRALDIDLEKTVLIYSQLRRLDISVGFAGGFASNNVRQRINFLKSNLGTNAFSIDAEGKLRAADDTLDLREVELYISEAITAMLEKK